MKLKISFFVALVCILAVGCSKNKTNKPENSVENTTTSKTNSNANVEQVDKTESYDSIREYLKFEIPDTLKFSRAFHFSNQLSKDSFLLIINPGLINRSKSELKIITTKGDMIYSQVFDSYCFISGIFQPTSVPPAERENYDQYLIKYRKSLTANQYDSYVEKKIKQFFETIYFVKKDRLNEINKWGEEANKEALKEVVADTTIIIVDVPYFDSYEGGQMFFYSKRKNAIKILLDHD